MASVGVLLAGVQGGIDKSLELRVASLGHLVEVDQLGVDVIDDLALRRGLGKEDGAAAAEGFGVELVVGDERQDVFEERLLAAVIRDGCFHRRRVLSLKTRKSSRRRTRMMATSRRVFM